ncbi:hypothetical protein DSL92_08765 [Billgrantia gudaonensis]|uniref:ABC transmembrane type-1 domain-containing protein n=1 Tax=Billgrantia gudaonensis TaxID=376427 RepID=A0A3S0NWG7_9GAMM|nr:hypothetical protein DSL92_08765 [Halomonas gudaonensis]
MASRLTADTSVLQTLFGSSISLALRNLVMLMGASVLMLITQPWLSTLLLGIPVTVLPILWFGRRVRRCRARARTAWPNSAATLARRSLAYAPCRRSRMKAKTATLRCPGRGSLQLRRWHAPAWFGIAMLAQPSPWYAKAVASSVSWTHDSWRFAGLTSTPP